MELGVDNNWWTLEYAIRKGTLRTLDRVILRRRTIRLPAGTDLFHCHRETLLLPPGTRVALGGDALPPPTRTPRDPETEWREPDMLDYARVYGGNERARVCSVHYQLTRRDPMWAGQLWLWHHRATATAVLKEDAEAELLLCFTVRTGASSTLFRPLAAHCDCPRHVFCYENDELTPYVEPSAAWDVSEEETAVSLALHERDVKAYRQFMDLHPEKDRDAEAVRRFLGKYIASICGRVAQHGVEPTKVLGGVGETRGGAGDPA